MTNTSISISATGTRFHAVPDTAPFSPGDTVTFTLDAGAGDAVICFSGSAAEIVSPSPDGPVSLTRGSSLSYTVTGQAEKGCCVNIVPPSGAGTPDGGESPAGTLFISTPADRPGPPDSWQN
jgi:hypothetical protein